MQYFLFGFIHFICFLKMAARRILLYDARRNLRSRDQRTRSNLFDRYDDSDFYQRFRFDKESVEYLAAEFAGDVTSKTNHYPISAETKMLITLRFMASNSLQQVIGDTFGVSKSVVNGAIWQVIPKIASRMNDFICLPVGPSYQHPSKVF